MMQDRGDTVEEKSLSGKKRERDPVQSREFGLRSEDKLYCQRRESRACGFR